MGRGGRKGKVGGEGRWEGRGGRGRWKVGGEDREGEGRWEGGVLWRKDNKGEEGRPFSKIGCWEQQGDVDGSTGRDCNFLDMSNG